MNARGNIPDAKLSLLSGIIGKMSLKAICVLVLPELGLRWRELTKAVRYLRLPMTPISAAKILRRYVARNITEKDLDDIIGVLRLKYMAVNSTKHWHTITLSERIFEDEPIEAVIRLLKTRVLYAACRIVRMWNARPKVYATNVDSFMFLSLQMLSTTKASPVLYVALLPNEPVAFVSSLGNKRLIQSVAEGRGYKKYEDAKLHGPDLMSLLRVIDRSEYKTNVGELLPIPYDPKPVMTAFGIDYTFRTYNEAYVDAKIGPDPPLLTHLEVECVKPFHDRELLDMNVRITMSLKCNNVADVLKSWVVDKVVSPKTRLLTVFNCTRSNRFVLPVEEEH